MSSTMLPRARWKLLNLLWHQTATSGFRMVRNLAAVTGVDGDDLVALEARGLILARQGGQWVSLAGGQWISLATDCGVAGASTDDLGRLAPNVNLRLTGGGLTWIDGDTYNRVLWLLGSSPTARLLPVDRLVRDQAVELDGLVGCYEQGLIAFVDADTGDAYRGPGRLAARQIIAVYESRLNVVAELTAAGLDLFRPDR